MPRFEYFRGSFKVYTAWPDIYGAAYMKDFGGRIDAVAGQIELERQAFELALFRTTHLALPPCPAIKFLSSSIDNCI